MLLAIPVMVSLAYAHVHCYPTVDNPWGYATACFGESDQRQSFQWAAIVAFGCGHNLCDSHIKLMLMH